MAKKLAQIMEKIPLERRNKIEARAKELIAEHLTLRDLRKARELTQERMAELLKIRQDSVSRIEKRTDVLISTLRSYVEAMGGDLQLIVKFPDRPSVIITGLAELERVKPVEKEKTLKQSENEVSHLKLKTTVK